MIVDLIPSLSSKCGEKTKKIAVLTTQKASDWAVAGASVASDRIQSGPSPRNTTENRGIEPVTSVLTSVDESELNSHRPDKPVATRFRLQYIPYSESDSE